MHHHHPRANEPAVAAVSLAAVSLAAVLSGCSADVKNMGENWGGHDSEIPETSHCAASPTLAGDVTVEDQAQLNELEGCEAILGNLTVVPFEGADLRPLHALVSVEGLLAFSVPTPEGGWVMRLGDTCYSDCPEGLANGAEHHGTYADLYEAGWLASLEGLESLETVGGLRLMGFGGASLEPLSHLRALTDGGYLRISRCKNLVDLGGLANLTGIVDLDIECENLESLAGLKLPQLVNAVRIGGAKLADLGPFAVRRVTSFLELHHTALANLDALAHLESVSSTLVINDNPLLADISGLDGLINAGELMVNGAGRLEQFPAFKSLVQLNSLVFIGNPVLRDVSLFHDTHYRRRLEGSHLSQDPWFAAYAIQLEVTGNPELVSFALPLRWRWGRFVRIGGNDKLRDLDLGSLEGIDNLTIAYNESLESVSFSQLGSVNRLEIARNPKLPAATFDGIPTFVTIPDPSQAPATDGEPAP
jgi:hypothetical protein